MTEPTISAPMNSDKRSIWAYLNLSSCIHTIPHALSRLKGCRLSNLSPTGRIGLQGGAMNVAICTDNEFIDGDLDLFDECLHEDDEIISERLHTLADLIKNKMT